MEVINNHFIFVGIFYFSRTICFLLRWDLYFCLFSQHGTSLLCPIFVLSINGDVHKLLCIFLNSQFSFLLTQFSFFSPLVSSLFGEDFYSIEWGSLAWTQICTQWFEKNKGVGDEEMIFLAFS